MDEIAGTAEVQQKTADADLPVESWYRMVNYEDSKAFIRANLQGAARSFIAIGYYLKHIRDEELYREDGHETIWDFAMAEYGISKSTASRYMSMNDRFSQGGDSPLVDDRYKDYDKSKLQEMLSLTDVQIEQVTPDSTVQEIRRMRKPKEIPYFELEGQLDLAADFPEVLPDVFEETEAMVAPVTRSFMLNVADLIGEELAGGNICTANLMEMEDPLSKPMTEYLQEQGRRALEIKPVATVATPELLEEELMPEPQELLPILKNNDQRKEWLEAYHDWPVWFSVPEASEIYYRYDLPDGSSLVICEYKYWSAWIVQYGYNDSPEKTGTREYIIDPGYHYLYDCRSSRSAMIEKLKEIQREQYGKINDTRQAH